MDPFLLQKQLKENSNDLSEFYKELNTWREEINKKEEALKSSTEVKKKLQEADNKVKKKITSINKKQFSKDDKGKTKITDYTAWEKFDADAECEKVDYDENDESELTDECDETMRDEAFLQKEKGNKFVKDMKWDEAIKCYTKAIDCYAFDPIFYANRALCFLKKQNMQKAEDDCTMSLKLDKSYVKAYQRRAAAREALNKLEEAELDLIKVLEFEPNNQQSKKALEALRNKLEKNKIPESPQRPISKFTASRNQNKVIPSQTAKSISTVKPVLQWPNDGDIIPVRPVNKPVHLRSKKPLKRIEIKEIESPNDVESELVPVKTRVIEKHESYPRPNSAATTLKTDELKIVEKQNTISLSKDVKNTNNISVAAAGNNLDMKVPKNSVQFYSQWKQLKAREVRYNYLKLIKPEDFPTIFKDNLESQVFSEILEVLADSFIENKEKLYGFLYYMTHLRRFSTLVMFLTDGDKSHLWKLFDYIKQSENKPKEEVDLLINKYEL